MNAGDVEGPKVTQAAGRLFVDVPVGRGEEFRIHLEAHNIRSRLTPPSLGPYERLEVEADVHPDVLRAIADRWER